MPIDDRARSESVDARSVTTLAKTLTTSGWGRSLLWLGSFALSVAMERRRIAKGAVKGAHRVDAKTGAPPSLRQTIILLGTRLAVQRGARAIPLPAAAARLHDPEVSRELHEAHRLHADDQASMQSELERIYAKRQIRPWAACLPVLVRGGVIIAVNRCPLPFLSEWRTLADLLAGTKLARMGPSRWSRLRRRPASSRIRSADG